MRWSLDEVAAIVNGVATGEAVVSAVTTDSRTVPAGALFVALHAMAIQHRLHQPRVAEGIRAVHVGR